MLNLARSISGALLLTGGIVLLLAARDEYRRQRWIFQYRRSMRTSSGPLALLLVSAAGALAAGAWLLGMI